MSWELDRDPITRFVFEAMPGATVFIDADSRRNARPIQMVGAKLQVDGEMDEHEIANSPDVLKATVDVLRPMIRDLQQQAIREFGLQKRFEEAKHDGEQEMLEIVRQRILKLRVTQFPVEPTVLDVFVLLESLKNGPELF